MNWRRILWVASLAFAVAGTGQAQEMGQVESPILIIDSDRLFLSLRRDPEMREKFESLQAEFDGIAQKLEAEEQALTDQRASLSPEEFRELADAFDEKAQRLRAEQLARDQEFQLEERENMLGRLSPVIEGIMRDTGAILVMEKTAVFSNIDAIDVTDLAILRFNAVVADPDGDD